MSLPSLYGGIAYEFFSIAKGINTLAIKSRKQTKRAYFRN